LDDAIEGGCRMENYLGVNSYCGITR